MKLHVRDPLPQGGTGIIGSFSMRTPLFYRAFTINKPYNEASHFTKEAGITMEEFLRVRVAIDSLIDGTKLSIQNKALAESMAQLEQARALILELKQMSTSEEDYIVAKRETAIEYLAINANKIKKQPIKKKSAKEPLAQQAIM